MSEPLRVLVWSSIPTHHQSAFFQALRERGVDLVVLYYLHVTRDRAELGWAADPVLPPGEHYVTESLTALEQCPDWEQRIHIVPGYSNALLLKLAWRLTRRRIPWLHWGEHSERTRRGRLRSRLTQVVKLGYGQLIRRAALGALAIGELARREFIGWGIDETRIRFLPYSVAGFPPPGGPALSPSPRESGATRFVFVGQLIPRKGIDVLLKAMRLVHDRHPRARLELAGSDPSRGTYPALARELGLDAVVRFTGTVPANEVGNVIARSDVLILPARHDGWGVVLNEAASAGKAIIASSATGAAHHLVVPGMNGFRFAAGQVEELAQAMQRYCEDAWLARDHGLASARLFQEFTPARNAERFIEAVDALRDQAARGARNARV